MVVGVNFAQSIGNFPADAQRDFLKLVKECDGIIFSDTQAMTMYLHSTGGLGVGDFEGFALNLKDDETRPAYFLGDNKSDNKPKNNTLADIAEQEYGIDKLLYYALDLFSHEPYFFHGATGTAEEKRLEFDSCVDEYLAYRSSELDFSDGVKDAIKRMYVGIRKGLLNVSKNSTESYDHQLVLQFREYISHYINMIKSYHRVVPAVRQITEDETEKSVKRKKVLIVDNADFNYLVDLLNDTTIVKPPTWTEVQQSAPNHYKHLLQETNRVYELIRKSS